MANVYSQIYIQIVMSPKGRQNLIQSSVEKEIFSYISGTITNLGHKSIIVNGMPDHVHMFVGLNPAMAISDLVREIKKSSNKFINSEKLCTDKFYWQNGFGAFSYGRSQIKTVYDYIKNQKKHHKKWSFKSEYIKLLEKFEIDYKKEYLFDFYND